MKDDKQHGVDNQTMQDEAAKRELKNLRAYTVRGLKHAMFEEGIGGVLALLDDAHVRQALSHYYYSQAA